MSGSWNGEHKGGDEVVVAGWELPGIVEVGALDVVLAMVPEVGPGTGPPPTIPVDARTATV